MKDKKFFFLLIIQLIVCRCALLHAQTPAFPAPAANIQGIQFAPVGNQMAYPVINIGAQDVLQLDFDDLDNKPKEYYYTFVLCDDNWQPVVISPFDYLKGFQQNRIKQYNYSSIAKTKYIHYQQLLPQQNSMPTRSGNYLLKVFLNGDTTQLAFAKRLLIVDNKVSVAAEVQQPRDLAKADAFQKVQFSIDISRLKVQNPLQQLKVVVLQNFRWDNAIRDIQPAFMRGNVYEYNGERDVLFSSGKEYRWIDLRSFRFQSERIRDIDVSQTPFAVNVLPDQSRTDVAYLPYADNNGFYSIAASEQINPWWQGDYAKVHFTFVPEGGKPYANKNVYLIGQMNDYVFDKNNCLQFNADKGLYEADLLLKQGYYSYIYATKDADNLSAPAAIEATEGNYRQTENDYTILVYYQSFSDRAPQLVSCTTINSQKNR